MQHLCTSSQVLQTKDLRPRLHPLDATLPQNRGIPPSSRSFRPFRFPIFRVPFWNSPLVTRHCPVASVTIRIQCAGDHDGTVWGWRPERVGEEGEGGGAAAAGAVADAEVAGASLRECAAF